MDDSSVKTIVLEEYLLNAVLWLYMFMDISPQLIVSWLAFLLIYLLWLYYVHAHYSSVDSQLACIPHDLFAVAILCSWTLVLSR